MHPGEVPLRPNVNMVTHECKCGCVIQVHQPVACGCVLVFVQVFSSGRMVVFTKNCLEIGTKVVLFKNFKVGLQAETQLAMFSNLAHFFDL